MRIIYWVDPWKIWMFLAKIEGWPHLQSYYLIRIVHGLFWSKIKKTRMDSEGKLKVCLMKVPLFLLKNALGPRYKSFYIFLVIPLRGHFRHASPAPISICFFLFFTNNQPQIYLSVRELFSKKFIFNKCTEY